MGTYIAQADLVPGLLQEQDLVQLTNDSDGPDPDTVVDAVVDQAILDAEAEVDGYLGTRYALPLQTVPRIVKTLAARVAVYKLRSRRPNTLTEDQTSDYDRATKMLVKISEGVVTLGSQPEPSANAERIIKTSTTDRVYGRSNLSDF